MIVPNTKKGSSSIDKYFLKIKIFVDSLASINYIVSTVDHLETIFEGLSLEYDTFITFVVLKIDPFTIDEINSLLLAQEGRINTNNKSLDSSPSDNMTIHNQFNNDKKKVCFIWSRIRPAL